jgi:hypothetical protein
MRVRTPAMCENAGGVRQNAGDVRQNAGDVRQNAGDVRQNASWNRVVNALSSGRSRPPLAPPSNRVTS